MVDINPEKYYSPREIGKMKILPWSTISFRKKLKQTEWRLFFNPIVETIKEKDHIHIKGEYIIKFIKAAENGDFN